MRQAATILTGGAVNFTKDSDHVGLITFLVFLLFRLICKVVQNLQLRIRNFGENKFGYFFSANSLYQFGEFLSFHKMKKKKKKKI